ncbi:hypothetical protein ACS5NO_32205 [Larkinella sp. GY13]|uniref:hypothetical protein n=1 Tax=Larkinella sp. GY13 TaxID=3453720 RepID=UPI003EE8D5C2
MNTKGTSDEARDYSAQVRDRFIQFFTERGMKAVSDKTGCNEQVFRNCLNGTRPAVDTLCQVKLGYGEEFDINYLFTGIKSEPAEIPTPADNSQFEAIIENLKKQLGVSQEKIGEKDDLIKSLKEDKVHLQNDKQLLADIIRKAA